MIRVHVDSEKCQGHNRCFNLAPELFDLDDLGYSHERDDGAVPPDMEGLTALHGVGRKTASIVLGAAFKIPAVAVDRHVARVATRLGLSKATDPDRIEEDLRSIYPRRDWIKVTWTFVLHGRRTCTPTPACPGCPVLDLCPYPRKTR